MSDDRKDHSSLSSLRLTHAAVMTTDLDRALPFYRDIVGLNLRIVESDPIRKGRRRAMLTDSQGQDTIEVIEMTEMAHPSIPGRGGIHHIGFRLPRREWHALRSRMDEKGYAYEDVEGRLFVRDADGLVLEIEQV